MQNSPPSYCVPAAATLPAEKRSRREEMLAVGEGLRRMSEIIFIYICTIIYKRKYM